MPDAMRDRLLPALAGLVFLLVCAVARADDMAFSLTPAAIDGAGDQISLRSADFDRDGDLDLVSISGSAGGALAWLENDGGVWTAHTIALLVNAASQAQPVDLDQDGDMDMLAVIP